MGDLFLRGRRLLESGGCRHLRIYDQSADRALLHAGIEYHCSPRAWRAVRGLRHAWVGVDALLFARDEAGRSLERALARVRFLGHQYRHADGNRFEPAANRIVADLPISLCRLLVGPQRGVHANSTHAVSTMD